MWPNKVVSNLQKTYDESYLKCSTAVYYESQGDEQEATASWKSALEQISQNSASRRQPSYVPKSETERALLESIGELEVQCKERIDLLEALRVSREDNLTRSLPSPTTTVRSRSGSKRNSVDAATPERGFIGDGTIPAITYTELSRPPLPGRPNLSSRRTSSDHTIAENSRSLKTERKPAPSPVPRQPGLPPYDKATSVNRVERSSSPSKHTMRTTLRSSRPEKASSSKLSKSTNASKTTRGPGASKAATLAWTGVGTPVRSEAAESSKRPRRLPEGNHSSENSSRRGSAANQARWDHHTRRLVEVPAGSASRRSTPESPGRISGDLPHQLPSSLALGAASSAINSLSIQDRHEHDQATDCKDRPAFPRKTTKGPSIEATSPANESGTVQSGADSREGLSHRKFVATTGLPEPNSSRKRAERHSTNDTWHDEGLLSSSEGDEEETDTRLTQATPQRRKGKKKAAPGSNDTDSQSQDDIEDTGGPNENREWEQKKKTILKNLPPGVDDAAAKAIFNEIVVQGDEVRWSDVAGLEIAKAALREAVVYPFLRPDLFMGLREPARGMLLFGPPGTGKTMLARAVATESRSTFFSISASSLTSKYLGESEKLVRALFGLAKIMAPSIIFVDEIDSLLSQRAGSGEHEATRRIKTEFLIQWSDLQRAAAGRESPAMGSKDRGDPNRVLVLAATNLPWAIDEAARRRFVRRQYIPLPEDETRATQLRTLLGQQKHGLGDEDIAELVTLTEGFSGSDITALAKDAAMGPLRSLGEALLHMTMDQIRPIELGDFKASLRTIRPSVGKDGLKEYEDWARQYGERGG